MIHPETEKLTLNPEHRAYLGRCALSDEIIDGRPYYSLGLESRKYLRQQWGFSSEALRGEGIVIPRYSPDGAETYPQIRYDEPRVFEGNGKPRKYNAPVGSGGVIDAHPQAMAPLQDVNEPLVFTESIKNADALLSAGVLAVGFHGVWGWKHNGGPSLELRKIQFTGRSVGICFDVDVHSSKDLQKAIRELGGLLQFAGATKVMVFVLPPTIGPKGGVDDYLSMLQSAVGGGA